MNMILNHLPNHQTNPEYKYVQLNTDTYRMNMGMGQLEEENRRDGNRWEVNESLGEGGLLDR
jgi:hypothetical protein